MPKAAPTAAEEITQATDAVAAQITATQEELAEALSTIETLNATVADRDASLKIMADTNDTLTRRVAELEATGRFSLPDEATMHGLWTAAGGEHGRFETAKRFAKSLG